ncbi:ATP-binding protein [Succinatimonas hippei]|uniref:ATP-binding protein n=1 Tax=Succinatimonas hippei TaxID=626938 RepID=UPI00249008B8|nr:ATP-binding protein [Succinatimonas hippei]
MTIEPDCIRIINYGGPDHSIKLDELNRGVVRARRYRNRKLGDFLKELDLTEGKATSIPTIIKEMKANGSPAALFEADDARTFFIASFPIHPAFSSRAGEWVINKSIKVK